MFKILLNIVRLKIKFILSFKKKLSMLSEWLSSRYGQKLMLKEFFKPVLYYIVDYLFIFLALLNSLQLFRIAK
jgi:hypothetical protein